MPLEEFLKLIRNFQQQEAKYSELAKKFHKKLPEALKTLVFEHQPELLGQKEKQEKNITTIAEKYAGEVWEKFNMAYGRQYTKKEVATYKVPKPATKADEEKKLQNELAGLPKKYHKGYCEIFWETSKQNLAHETFVFAVHAKMKEAFTEIYLDDVLSLEPVYLRYFNSSLYLLADSFVQDIYDTCNI